MGEKRKTYSKVQYNSETWAAQQIDDAVLNISNGQVNNKIWK